MEHVVFYTGHDGLPSFRRVDSLNEAVALVEHLRNSKNVSDTTVYALSSVPLDFRPYYRAEVPAEAYAAEALTTVPVVINEFVPDARTDNEPLALAPTVDAETHVPAPHISLVPDLARYEGHELHGPAPLPFAPLGFEPIALHADAPGAEPVEHIGLEADPIAPAVPLPADAAEARDAAYLGDIAMVVPALSDDATPLATVVQLHPAIAVEPELEPELDDAGADAELAIENDATSSDDAAEVAVDHSHDDITDGHAVEVITDQPLASEAQHVEPEPEPEAEQVEPEAEAVPEAEQVEAEQDEAERAEPAGAPLESASPVDESDHLGALAELAAQVAEDSESDPVDDESVEVRYEPEAFAAESGELVHDHVDPSADAEPDIAETDLTDLEPAREGSADEPAAAVETIDEAGIDVTAVDEAATDDLATDDVAADDVATVDVTSEADAERVGPQPTEHRDPPVDVFVVSDEAINELFSQSEADAATVEALASEAASADGDHHADNEIESGTSADADGDDADDAAPAPDDAPVLETASLGHPGGLDPAAMDADPATHVRLAAGVPSLTDEELAAVGELPPVPVARGVSPEPSGRREGARSLGFFAR